VWATSKVHVVVGGPLRGSCFKPRLGQSSCTSDSIDPACCVRLFGWSQSRATMLILCDLFDPAPAGLWNRTRLLRTGYQRRGPKRCSRSTYWEVTFPCFTNCVLLLAQCLGRCCVVCFFELFQLIRLPAKLGCQVVRMWVGCWKAMLLLPLVIMDLVGCLRFLLDR